MIVLYYTQTHYLDATLETIQSIKNDVDLHLLIEIAPESKISNIIHVENLNQYDTITEYDNVLNPNDVSKFKKYFNGLARVSFVVHKSRKSFSYKSLLLASHIKRYINYNKIDIVHFDTLSLRSLFILPFVINNRKLITIHDPVPHTGEASWKKKLIKYAYLIFFNQYVFYSDFAREQFNKQHHDLYKKLTSIRLLPYTFYQQFKTTNFNSNKAILFFGRMSFYKGIDLFIEAIPFILNEYPNQQFVIAGNPDHYNFDMKKLSQYCHNIRIINTYLNTAELTDEICQSKFVVCPYRDATQSGVLMTSKALGKMVLATNVGSFSEYIINGFNGILIEPTVSVLARSIITLIRADNYIDYENNIKTEVTGNTLILNRHFLLNAYQNI